MSKEYIEKEAAINYLTLNMCWYDEEGGQVDDWDERKAIISDLLDGIPPANVAPVMKGEWITVSESARDGGEYKCSACGWECCDDEFGDDPTEDYRFCPNCGADMREGANDER